jgi:hypothetical protein
MEMGRDTQHAIQIGKLKDRNTWKIYTECISKTDGVDWWIHLAQYCTQQRANVSNARIFPVTYGGGGAVISPYS